MKKTLLFLAICTLLFTPFTKAQNVSTLAGSGAFGFNDGQGVLAQFNSAYGACIDASGNIYVADTYNYRIRKITPTGSVTTLAGSGINNSVDGTGTGASFMNPTSVCVDQSGNVYVTESTQPRIRKISPSGVVTTLAGNGMVGSTDGPGNLASFNSMGGICVDVSGTIYVADGSNRKVRMVSPTGSVTTIAGNSGPAGYVDGIGSGASFTYLSAICISSTGDLYVADANKIRKVTVTGTVTTIAGTGTVGSLDGLGSSASFNYPQGICADGSNNLYVSDTENHLIRKIDPSGLVSTLAGTGSSGSTDGFGTSASFNRPFDVCVDASGNLFVADFNNAKIRKIDFTASGIFDQDAFAKQVVIFPNPAQNYIQVYSSAKINSVKIYDLNGNTVLSIEKEVAGIDIGALSAGFYFIESTTAESIIKQKFIKQ